MGSTTINRKISEFEDIMIERQKRDTIARVEEAFDKALASEDGHSKVRHLVEKLNLAIGNRRMKHIDVRPDRRAS